MRQRTTFVVSEKTHIDPEQIQIGEDHLKLTHGSDVAKESHYTFSLSRLPDNLRNLAGELHELHIRWASPTPYHARTPFVSRIPPGLHVSYTPRKPETTPDICRLLHALFSPDLKCSSTAEAFSSLPVLSERFSSSASYQYFSLLPGLSHLESYAIDQLCAAEKGHVHAACTSEAAAISQADYLDIDFDVISHAVAVTAYWGPNGDAKDSQSTTIRKPTPGDRVEIGVLQPTKGDELEELGLGGYLTVLGEDSKPSRTVFSFPSRHHPYPPQSSLTYTSHFLTPTGLHPTLALSFSHPPQAPQPPLGNPSSCSLHAYLTLPSALFLDRYQFTDPLFLAAHNLKKLIALSGEQDLEAPEWAIQRWGSAALFELATPPSNPSPPEIQAQPPLSQAEWTATIPLHLRYLAPSNQTNSDPHSTLSIPAPILFHACPAPEAFGTASTNPFDRTNMGYDGLFGTNTVFYHLTPASASGPLVETLQVPVLEARHGMLGEGAVRWGTLGVVIAGFVWVVWSAFGGRGGASGQRGGEGKKMK
ncbi:hypothetical protein MBLNU230_g2685t1 [Neophaeotheca triangularis]